MAAAAPPVNTVLDAIIACSVDSAVLFGGNTEAQCIAADLFDDSYVTAMVRRGKNWIMTPSLIRTSRRTKDRFGFCLESRGTSVDN